MKIDYITTDMGVKYAELTPTVLERKRFEKIGITLPDKMHRVVKTDAYGWEYFDLPNYRSPKENKHFSFGFHIRDAVAEIKNGNGDEIIYEDRIGNDNTMEQHQNIHVIHYVDRGHGLYRKSKTLNEVRDYKFDYTIIVYDPNHFSNHFYITYRFDLYFISRNSNLLSTNYAHFPSYSKAEKTVNRLVAMSEDLANWAFTNNFDLAYDFEECEDKLDQYPTSITNIIRGGYLVSYDEWLKLHNDSAEDIERYYVARVAQDISKE